MHRRVPGVAVEDAVEEKRGETDSMRIGILWRKQRNVGQHARFLEQALQDDSREEVEKHKESLEAAGHEAEIIEWTDDPSATTQALRAAHLDLVFNASSVEETALLHILGLRFAGSPLSMVTLDKSAQKRLVCFDGIPTPKFLVLPGPDEERLTELAKPVIVKPVRGRNSCGITDESVTGDDRQIKLQAQKIHRTLGQEALVEEFIAGREITVGIIGNEEPRILPPMEVKYRGARTNTFEHKKDNEILRCPAELSAEERAAVVHTALGAYRALGARDCARIDMIMSATGTPFFLELNSFPGLHRKSGDEVHLHSSYVGIMAEAEGWSPADLYGRIIEAASSRDTS